MTTPAAPRAGSPNRLLGVGQWTAALIIVSLLVVHEHRELAAATPYIAGCALLAGVGIPLAALHRHRHRHREDSRP